MLRPNYIFGSSDSGPAPDKATQENNNQNGQKFQEKINPKLRQCFEVKTKIEPFYTGGKLVILSPCHFVCQCGPCVKMISTSRLDSNSNNANDKSSSNRTLQIDGQSKDKEDDEDDDEDKKLKRNECFQVIRNFECDMDEIISFDANPQAQVLITSHKSNLLRLWSLNISASSSGNDILEPKKTIKSFHQLPILHLEFDKNLNDDLLINGKKNAGDFKNDGGHDDDDDNDEEEVKEVERDNNFEELRWASVAGSVLKIWETGGSQVSKALRIDNVASLGLVKWCPASLKKQRLFVAERNIYVIDFDSETKQYVVSHTCEGHFSQVTGIEWDGNDLLISGGRDNVIILWDTNKSFSRLKTIQLPGSVEGMIGISPTDLYLALSPSDIRYFNMENHKLSKKSVLSLGSDEAVMAFHPLNNHLTDSSVEPGDGFWISTLASSVYQVGKKIGDDKKQPNLQIRKQFVGSLDEIFAVTLWIDMKVAVANNTSIIRVYNLENGSCNFLRGHKDIVLCLSVQNNWLVSGSKDNSIIFWTSDSDVPQFVLSGHIASVTSVCFDPLRMIVYSAAEDTFIKAWTQTECIQSVVAHTKEIHSVHCSPNGAMIVSASRDKTAKIWDSDTLTLLGTLKGHKKSIWCAKFSPWDQLVVTASADTTLKIWDIPAFTCRHTLQGHTSSVLQAVFINSGLQVLSTSSDGTFKSWDLRNSTCVSTFDNSEDKIWALDAVPDGSLLVTGSADSILTVWVDVTEEKHKETVEKKNKLIEEDQRLTNLLRKGEWEEALRLSIELDRPFTLLKIVRDVSRISDLEYVITALSHENKTQLLTYIKRWNTNSRTSTEAQTLLNILLTCTPPSELAGLQTYALLPFTQRHFQRVQKNMQQIALVKYLADKSVD